MNDNEYVRSDLCASGQQVRALTLSKLQAANVARQDEWCPDQKPDLSFRGNEFGGECGEARNVIKKLERERHELAINPALTFADAIEWVEALTNGGGE